MLFKNALNPAILKQAVKRVIASIKDNHKQDQPGQLPGGKSRRFNQMFLEPCSTNYDTFGPDFQSISNGKIVIFGIPKSGNAWLQSLLVQYFNTQAVLSLEPAEPQGVLSIHDPFENFMLQRRDFANGVCLIRDIRDVIVSYFHYGKTQEFRLAMTRFYYEDFDSFYYEWFLSRCVPAHRLLSFATEYAERGIPMLRYERLQADTCGELARLIARWGISPDRDRIAQIVANHQLDKLKQQGLDVGYQVEPSHFRKGGWGNFLTEMPAHILVDVNTRFQDFLSRWGYPLELTETSVQSYRGSLQRLGN